MVVGGAIYRLGYNGRMKTKPLTFLLALTFLFLFFGSVFADDFQDGSDAYARKDYKAAYELWLLFCQNKEMLTHNST